MINFESPPLSPLRLEGKNPYTCSTGDKRKGHRDWMDLFRKIGQEVKNIEFRKKYDFDLFDSHGLNGLHAAVIMNDFELVKVGFI